MSLIVKSGQENPVTILAVSLRLKLALPDFLMLSHFYTGYFTTLITIAWPVVAVVPSGRVALTTQMQIALPFFNPFVTISQFCCLLTPYVQSVVETFTTLELVVYQLYSSLTPSMSSQEVRMCV